MNDELDEGLERARQEESDAITREVAIARQLRKEQAEFEANNPAPEDDTKPVVTEDDEIFG